MKYAIRDHDGRLDVTASRYDDENNGDVVEYTDTSWPSVSFRERRPFFPRVFFTHRKSTSSVHDDPDERPSKRRDRFLITLCANRYVPVDVAAKRSSHKSPAGRVPSRS